MKASSSIYSELSSTLLEVIPASLLVLDHKGTVLFANNNYLLRSRKRESQVKGKTLKQIFPKVIFDQTPLVEQVQQVIAGGDPIRGERLTYRAPGVPTRIYYYSILPLKNIDAEGEANVMLLMEDITEQSRLSAEVQRVERELSGVVENAGDIILSTDSAGKILTWNSAAERITGLGLESARGMSFFDLAAGDEQKKSRELFKQMLNTKKGIEGDWQIQVDKQRPHYISWRLSPMQNEFGQLQGMVAVGRDLTEHMALEEKLRHSQKLAALGVMAGGIAHEVRNPLAVCSSAAQILEDHELPEDMRTECTEKIRSSIKRASDIIENLLRFARPDAEGHEKVMVSLNTIIEESIKLVENQAKVQKITIETRLRSQKIFGIPDLLRQVFFNLLINAIRAMPGGGKLSVSISVSRKRERVLVVVSDTGTGISKEDIDKIFDPFHTTAPVGKGSGLGLSISYTIVQEHGGSMRVRSKPGSGTTITVEFPLPVTPS